MRAGGGVDVIAFGLHVTIDGGGGGGIDMGGGMRRR